MEGFFDCFVVVFDFFVFVSEGVYGLNVGDCFFGDDCGGCECVLDFLGDVLYVVFEDGVVDGE